MSDGKAEFGAHPSYPLIEKPHVQVHENLKEVIKLLVNKDITQESQKIISYFDNAEKNSKQLFTLLNELLKKQKD